MGKRLTDKHKKVQKRRFNLIVLIGVLVIMPVLMILNVSAAESDATSDHKGTQYSADQYIYLDGLSDPGCCEWYKGRVNWFRKDGTRNDYLWNLFIYDTDTIIQYNKDIQELIADFNKLSQNLQNSYISELNRAVNNLTNPTTGAFVKTFNFIMDGTDNHFESDCNNYAEEIRKAYETLSSFKGKIHNIAVSIGDVSSDEIVSPFLTPLKIAWLNIYGFLSAGAGKNQASGWMYDLFQTMSYDSIESFVYKYSPLFLTPAYLIFLLGFISNIMESSVRFDIADPKQVVKIFTRLIIGKVMLDGAVTVCLFALKFLNNIASYIIDFSSVDLLLTPSPSDNYSDIPIIGPIISFLKSAWTFLPYIVLCVVVFFCCIKVLVKLLVRTFELTALISVSPVFFACLSGEPTKKYFERFFVTFLSVAASIIFIGIVYAMGCHMLLKISNGAANDWYSQLIVCVILIAICQFITKPPKVFSSLLAA